MNHQHPNIYLLVMLNTLSEQLAHLCELVLYRFLENWFADSHSNPRYVCYIWKLHQELALLAKLSKLCLNFYLYDEWKHYWDVGLLCHFRPFTYHFGWAGFTLWSVRSQLICYKFTKFGTHAPIFSWSLMHTGSTPLLLHWYFTELSLQSRCIVTLKSPCSYPRSALLNEI